MLPCLLPRFKSVLADPWLEVYVGECWIKWGQKRSYLARWITVWCWYSLGLEGFEADFHAWYFITPQRITPHCKYMVVPLSKWAMAPVRQWWATEGIPLWFCFQRYLFSFFLMRQPLFGRKLSWSLWNGPQTASSFMALSMQTKDVYCLASSGSSADIHGNISFSLPSAPATTFTFKFLSYETNIYPWCSPKLQGIFLKFSEFSSVQSLSRVWLFVTPWTTACQASLFIINSQSLPKLMSIESVMPPNHLILSSPSPPAFNLSQHQGLFKWVSSSHQVAKILEFQLQHQSFQWTPRTDFLYDRLVGSPCSPRDSWVFSNTTVQKHQVSDA